MAPTPLENLMNDPHIQRYHAMMNMGHHDMSEFHEDPENPGQRVATCSCGAQIHDEGGGRVTGDAIEHHHNEPASPMEPQTAVQPQPDSMNKSATDDFWSQYFNEHELNPDNHSSEPDGRSPEERRAEDPDWEEGDDEDPDPRETMADHPDRINYGLHPNDPQNLRNRVVRNGPPAFETRESPKLGEPGWDQQVNRIHSDANEMGDDEVRDYARQRREEDPDWEPEDDIPDDVRAWQPAPPGSRLPGHTSDGETPPGGPEGYETMDDWAKADGAEDHLPPDPRHASGGHDWTHAQDSAEDQEPEPRHFEQPADEFETTKHPVEASAQQHFMARHDQAIRNGHAMTPVHDIGGGDLASHCLNCKHYSAISSGKHIGSAHLNECTGPTLGKHAKRSLPDNPAVAFILKARAMVNPLPGGIARSPREIIANPTLPKDRLMRAPRPGQLGIGQGKAMSLANGVFKHRMGNFVSSPTQEQNGYVTSQATCTNPGCGHAINKRADADGRYMISGTAHVAPCGEGVQPTLQQAKLRAARAAAANGHDIQTGSFTENRYGGASATCPGCGNDARVVKYSNGAYHHNGGAATMHTCDNRNPKRRVYD